MVYRVIVVAFSATCLYVFQADTRRMVSASTRLFAQKVVDDTLAMHPDIQNLELGATPPNKTECVTIASNEVMEIGEKCDREELAALKTNAPFVKKEKEDGKEIYEAILSIHDSTGSIIGIAEMDFKPEPGQERAKIAERAKQIAKELESQLTSKEKMFESEK
jgi:hypothetical protein